MITFVKNSHKMKTISATGLKPVLGAYSAMARNNVLLTLLDIMDRLHVRQRKISNPKTGKDADLEEIIWKLDLFPKNNSLNPEQTANAVKLLTKHFPFLSLLHDSYYNQKTVDALKQILPVLADKGYEFVTLLELFENKGIELTANNGIIYSRL